MSEMELWVLTCGVEVSRREGKWLAFLDVETSKGKITLQEQNENLVQALFLLYIEYKEKTE